VAQRSENSEEVKQFTEGKGGRCGRIERKVTCPEAANHYRTELGLSREAVSILYHFLLATATDIASYVRCRSTVIVEALHGLANKYAPKRLHYGIKHFSARRGLTVLDWNENISNERDLSKVKASSHVKHKPKKKRHVFRNRTHNFRNVIRDNYLARYRGGINKP
jgi:hypothetical protein